METMAGSHKCLDCGSDKVSVYSDGLRCASCGSWTSKHKLEVNSLVASIHNSAKAVGIANDVPITSSQAVLLIENMAEEIKNLRKKTNQQTIPLNETKCPKCGAPEMLPRHKCGCVFWECGSRKEHNKEFVESTECLRSQLKEAIDLIGYAKRTIISLDGWDCDVREDIDVFQIKHGVIKN